MVNMDLLRVVPHKVAVDKKRTMTLNEELLHYIIIFNGVCVLYIFYYSSTAETFLFA
jgi:hypothetical protein